jgi:hypothetical protein
MLSDGYAGPLPFGIQFHDTPEAVVARNPDARIVDKDTAALKWKLPDCVLHAMYSLIDHQVYRVSCFAPFPEAELFARQV